jgi:hypothetical protein
MSPHAGAGLPGVLPDRCADAIAPGYRVDCARFPKMRLLLAMALAALAICVVAIGCSGDSDDSTAATTDAPAGFFGVVSQTLLTDDDLDRMGTGKVGTLRVVLPWQVVDASPAPGDTDLSTIDPLVLGAARNGFQILPTIYGTPVWVAQDLDGEKCDPATTCPTFAPHSPAALDAWKEFVGEMVDRYGPGGEFWTTHPEVDPVPIRNWQIWNEQNSPTFFRPAPDPAAYEKLVSTAADAIRKRDPGAEVILGGMFATPLHGKPPAYVASDFLQQLYAIDGASADFDGVAVHPYAPALETIEEQVSAMHDEITKAGDDASMWITEIGASSAEGNYLMLGPDGQAELLRSAFEYFLANREAWNIENVTWYSWRDNSAPGLCDWCSNSGLFPEESLDPKPAWAAFVSFTGGA